MNAIDFLKALHIVGFVSWFAGLFYLVRLFVYHVEARERPAAERAVLLPQYGLMMQRLYRIITTPAMVITWLAGLGMLVLDVSGLAERAYFSSGTPAWLVVKLSFVALLTVYHGWCGRILRRLQAGEQPMSAWHFRLFNEAPTLLLILIVFTAVYGVDGRLNYLYLLLGVAVFALLIYRGARAYKQRRENL